ncbi:MAG: hypothetical protein ABSF98_24685 [Bryobacteraceae bacterium]|jgi:hypothetical protein
MRTTLNIDDESIHLARELAEQHRISLSDAASFLIKRGLAVSLPHRERNGFVLFNVDAGTPPFGPEDVDRAVQREDEDLSRFFNGRTDGASA